MVDLSYSMNVIAMPANVNAQRDNPCLKEQELSYACLNKNNYDRDACEEYFDNYNRCKAFWNRIRLERRRKGIVPNLPPVEERESIKREYLQRDH